LDSSCFPVSANSLLKTASPTLAQKPKTPYTVGMLWDAHCHLQDTRIVDLSRQLEEARQLGITSWIVCSIGPDDWETVRNICLTNQGCIPAYGIHPWYLSHLPKNWDETLASYLAASPTVIGEIGLDFEKENHHLQEIIFSRQLEIASQFSLPLNIHCRKAWHRLLPLMKPYRDRVPGFILHAFSQKLSVALQIIEYGGFLSFASHILRPWNTERLKKLIQALPLSRILIETDAPDIPLYSPETGLSGVSRLSNLLLVAQTICEWKAISLEELSESLTASRKQLKLPS